MDKKEEMICGLNQAISDVIGLCNSGNAFELRDYLCDQIEEYRDAVEASKLDPNDLYDTRKVFQYLVLEFLNNEKTRISQKNDAISPKSEGSAEKSTLDYCGGRSAYLVIGNLESYFNFKFLNSIQARIEKIDSFMKMIRALDEHGVDVMKLLSETPKDEDVAPTECGLCNRRNIRVFEEVMGKQYEEFNNVMGR